MSPFPGYPAAIGRWQIGYIDGVRIYRVDRRVIDEVRAGQRRDRELIEVAAWASMATARQIGSWAG
jgi:hypothetical protein